MTVMITGAGLIGRHVAEALVAAGRPPVVVDLSSAAGARLPADTRFRRGDVTDSEFVRRVVAEEGVRDIVHTAALMAVAARENPPAAARVNLGASLDLLELARQGLVRRVLLASSGSINFSVMETSVDAPIPEDFTCRVLSQGPGSFYIATKLALEHFCILYRRIYGVSAAALRFGAVLGAAGWTDTSLVSRLGLQVLEAAQRGAPLSITDQTFLWAEREEFIDPRDAARAVLAALDAADLAQPVYNITAVNGVTVPEFLSAAQAALPGLEIGEIATPEGGLLATPFPRRAPTDTSAAERDLGFKAEFGVGDALAHLAAQLPAASHERAE